MCMCAFLGTNAAHILSGVSEMLEKALGSPVPGTILLSLSGCPPSCSLEIAKAPGRADVSRLGLRISAELSLGRRPELPENPGLVSPAGLETS